MTTQPAPELIELERAPSSMEDVAANALRNVLGGLSIGGIVFVALSMTQLDWQTIAEWSLRATGLGVFAALIVFGLGDDLFNWWRRRQLAADLAAADEAMDWADGEIRRLRGEVRRLEYENAQQESLLDHFRKGRNYVEAVPVMSDDAMQDARQLIAERFRFGTIPTRRQMTEKGWTQGRYNAAFALLKQRGVVRVMENNRTDWADADAASATARLVGE